MDLIRRPGRDKGAVRRQAGFRPLCDKDGYPLVGNMANKSKRLPAEPVLQRPWPQGRESAS